MNHLVLIAALAAGGWYFATRKKKPAAPTEPELEPVVDPVVRDGSVETQAWGPVEYRVMQTEDMFSVEIRPKGANDFDLLEDRTHPYAIRMFKTPEDAEVYVASRFEAADNPTPRYDAAALKVFPGSEVPVTAGQQGPSGAGTCVDDIYSETPAPVAASVQTDLLPAAKGRVAGHLVYLTEEAQSAIFQKCREYFLGSLRSVPGLVVRWVLDDVAPDCDWDRDPYAGYTKQERLTWVSAWVLADAAAAQVGFLPGGPSPEGKLTRVDNKGVLISRPWLEIPDETSMALPLKRRVALLVGEYDQSKLPRPHFVYPEVVWAKVKSTDITTGAPLVEIISEFQEQDVTPKLSDGHGFKVGDVVALRTSSPTGVRLVYPEDVE